MKGYKAFNNDLTCLGYQYELDKTHVFEGEPILCESGFHFCTELQNVIGYYCFDDMRVFEIEAHGIISGLEINNKRSCSELKLIREISRDELIQSITVSGLAYWWVLNIGDKDVMINKIIDLKCIKLWIEKWPKDKQYFIDKGLI